MTQEREVRRDRDAVRGDYVLGTHDAEIERLGLQHRAWREAMLGAWRRAGLREGERVLDVGAGPGYATVDLADVVGPSGHVVAVERSPRFAAVLRARCERRGIANVELIESDLMAAPAVGAIDMAWCRWVASFVPSREALARWLASVVRPGGRVVFHEYVAYETWSYLPRRPELVRFVGEVMASWRAEGGEPNAAAPFVEALGASGFGIESSRPLIYTARPQDSLWRWPASFVPINLARLVELGRVTPEWTGRVQAELAEAEGDPASRVLTPLVLEVIARRS
jgi:protein-L-isoaspartate O-methyltransferase